MPFSFCLIKFIPVWGWERTNCLSSRVDEREREPGRLAGKDGELNTLISTPTLKPAGTVAKGFCYGFNLWTPSID